MSHRILLADDSQTIHKVMAYILSEGPFELEIARSVEELEEKLGQNSYDLVLLDFGLSNSENGHEIAERIRGKNQGLNIVMLFSAFDTIDEGKLMACGVREKVVKPFDSDQFLAICNSILTGKDSGTKGSIPPAPEGVEKDSWQMEGLSAQGPPPSPKGKNLKKEMEDWTVEIPPIIGSKEGGGDDILTTENLPPIIEEKNEDDTPGPPPIGDGDLALAEEGQLPPIIEGTPEFPGTGAIDLEKVEEGLPPVIDDSTKGPSPERASGPRMIPLSELNMDEGAGTSDDNATSTNIDYVRQEEEKVKNIGKTIDEEIDKSSLWAVDEVPDEQTRPMDIPTPPPPTPESNGQIDVDELMKTLGPAIEEKIRQHCQETIEKVAWEVIPELAENIIKKEIKAIKKLVVK